MGGFYDAVFSQHPLSMETSANLKQRIQRELVENILPFWMNQAVDAANGGFYGAVTNDLVVHNEVPRSSTLCARILWVYSTAYRLLAEPRYLEMAERAYDYLTRVFLDPVHRGVYWSVDCAGKAVADRKHHYAQAFAIYGLSEYYRATGKPESLALAQELYRLLEEHAYDPVYKGYTEGSSREWGVLEDMRLSPVDLNCNKSMNTHLHILEAYTNLIRVWDDAGLRSRHRELVETFIAHILNTETGHLKLFFDRQWDSLSATVSFGHDIEGSWLLLEAAEIQGDPGLVSKVRALAVKTAEAVLEQGCDADGAVLYEAKPDGEMDDGKAWWVQAEAVVGFYNAYQVSGREGFAEAARRCWEFIEAHLVDRVHGDWFKQLSRNCVPDYARFKVGPWDCPYHHSRACFEMMERL